MPSAQPKSSPSLPLHSQMENLASALVDHLVQKLDLSACESDIEALYQLYCCHIRTLNRELAADIQIALTKCNEYAQISLNLRKATLAPLDDVDKLLVFNSLASAIVNEKFCNTVAIESLNHQYRNQLRPQHSVVIMSSDQIHLYLFKYAASPQQQLLSQTASDHNLAKRQEVYKQIRSSVVGANQRRNLVAIQLDNALIYRYGCEHVQRVADAYFWNR